tara:strand:- start:829 stop:1311 length:483 start_codon:yes stop_codon:yes gene_type:complete
MSVTITGVNELYKNIDKLAMWSVKDSKALQDVGHRVGDVYANYIKANVKDLGKDISVRGTKVKSGQLRRSGGTWQPDKNRNTIMGGPRTNAIGRRKTKKAADGWYAHIVEKGDFGPRFGGKHRTQNTGVFARGIKSTSNRSIKLQEILLRKNFAKYTKRL